MKFTPCCAKTDQKGRELVSHGSPLFPAACYQNDLSADNVPWHWHDELEAVVVTEGSVLFSAGAQRRLLKCGKGIFINSGVPHAVSSGSGSGCLIHSAVFHPRLIGGSLDSIFWQSYVSPLLSDTMLKSVCLDGSAPWHCAALEAIEAAWQSFAAAQPGYEFQVRSELSRVIFQLSGCRSSSHGVSEKALRDSERIKIMLSFIQNHYNEPLSISALAAQAMISESECLRCFRSTIGASPIQYLKQFRVERSAELLLSGSGRIADIGALCGFSDTSYFIKSFREQKGCTPSAYRRQHSV